MDESEDKIYLSNSLFGNQKPQITLSPVRLQKIKGNLRPCSFLPDYDVIYIAIRFFCSRKRFY